MKTKLTGLLFLFLLFSCNKKSENLQPKDGVVINDDVVLIEKSAILKSIDSNKLVFSEKNLDVSKIETGYLQENQV